jgi:hypothetical protein
VLEAPAVTVLGTFEAAATSVPIGIVQAVEVIADFGIGFWVLLPPRRVPPILRLSSLLRSKTKVWSSPVNSKAAWDWSKAKEVAPPRAVISGSWNVGGGWIGGWAVITGSWKAGGGWTAVGGTVTPGGWKAGVGWIAVSVGWIGGWAFTPGVLALI